MSKIVERKESQHLIDVEEEKIVFEDGHEIHKVKIYMGGTYFTFTRHLHEGNRVSKNQTLRIHNLGETEITIMEKVKKNAKKFPTFVATKIKGLKA
jgi:hypothetical protein